MSSTLAEVRDGHAQDPAYRPTCSPSTVFRPSRQAVPDLLPDVSVPSRRIQHMTSSIRSGKHPWWRVTRTVRQAWLLGCVWLAIALWQLVPYALSVQGEGWGRWWVNLVIGLMMLLLAALYLGSAVARTRIQRRKSCLPAVAAERGFKLLPVPFLFRQMPIGSDKRCEAMSGKIAGQTAYALVRQPPLEVRDVLV
jgi:hypothetical protein